jgi:hypothetical protein
MYLNHLLILLHLEMVQLFLHVVDLDLAHDSRSLDVAFLGSRRLGRIVLLSRSS